MGNFQVIRRTFEARKYSKGSAERIKLNESSVTSEYLPSYKYAIIGDHFADVQRTRTEADAYVANLERVSADI